MIIRITDGETTQTLAAGSTRDPGQPAGPIDLQINGPVDAQQRRFLRGSASRFSNRGNMQTLLAFSVIYEFASLELAEIFVMTYRSTVLREGSVLMVTPAGAISTIADCVLQDPAVTMRGVTVRVAYQILGGAQTHVGAPEAAVDADGEAMFDATGEEMVFQTT